MSALGDGLLDRTAECEAIDRLLVGARRGTSGSLILRGEPGVGKSALLAYAAEAAAGMRVIAVEGVESEAEFHFAAVHRLVKDMVGGIADLPPPQRDALSSAFGLAAGVSPDTFLVGLAVLTLLSKSAEEQPVLCLVDNAHCLDRASAQVLAFTARRVDADAIAFLFAVGDPPDSYAELDGLPTLRVTGLSRVGSQELVNEAAGDEVADFVRDRMIDELLGNPLAILELLGDLTSGQLAGESPLPVTLPAGKRLEQTSLERVRRLPKETRQLLLLLAAEPGVDDALLWSAAEKLGISREALEPAEAAEVVGRSRPVMFRRSFLRGAVYGDAVAADRRRVHAALADATNPDVDPDRRAWHQAGAAVGPDELVAAALESSVMHARARGGHTAAAALLRRSAELTPDRGLKASRVLAAAQAEFAAGSPSRASSLLGDLSPHLLSELHQAQAQQLRGAIALAAGETSPMLLQAAQALETVDPRLARDAHLQALEVAMYAGRLGGVGAMLKAALAAKTAPSIGGTQAPADLLLDGFAARFSNDHLAAAGALREAVDVLHHHDDVRWLGLAYLAAVELWDERALQALSTRRVELANQTGMLSVLPSAVSQRGGYEMTVGRFDAAEKHFHDAREIAVATANPGIVGGTDPGTLVLSAWRGREADVRELANACILEATARGLGAFISLAYYALALLENGLGRYDEALRAAQEARVEDPIWASTKALPELVEAAARCGELDAAAEAARKLSEIALPSGTEWALGMNARCLALIAPEADAEALYQEALDHLKRSRALPELARAHLLYGEWLRRSRRRRDARRELRTAHDMFAKSGAEAFRERAEAELVATGEHIRPRTAETRDLLTPHELRIARMASRGSTNSEIGATLFLSPRTVEYHLHKVYGKLGISSRTMLADVLEQPKSD